MPIHAVSLDEAALHVVASLAARRGGWVVTPNVDILRRWVRDQGFRELIASASLNVADGVPLVWASRVQGTPLRGRVNGTDLVVRLSREAAARGLRVFLLGGAPGAAERAAKALRQKYPALIVAGVHCPAHGFEQDERQFEALVATVLGAQPDIVFVGLGSPKQDKVIARLCGRLPAAWWLGIGMSFSFIAGDQKRAPRLAQRLGLEWTYRVWCEPRRLARRYFIEGIPFFGYMLGNAFWRRCTGSIGK
jgi:N-acetylglucosaminyldiphosphoundecaprenol N-acetyl-beta-D-mannosaminyltransferase